MPTDTAAQLSASEWRRDQRGIVPSKLRQPAIVVIRFLIHLYNGRPAVDTRPSWLKAPAFTAAKSGTFDESVPAVFFQQGTSLSLAAVVPHFTETARSAELAELIRRRTELTVQRDQLDAKWLRIYQQLSERHRAGRRYVGEDGIKFGSLVGWPAADNGEAIRLGSGVLIRRPSPSDLRKLLGQETAELSREIAGEHYRLRVSQLRRRCRAKRA